MAFCLDPGNIGGYDGDDGLLHNYKSKKNASYLSDMMITR
jgi:hypothetical protein